LPDGQINGPIDLPVQPLSEKYFASRFGRNSFIDSVIHPTEGRIAIVTDAGLDAMDADGATDERVILRTAKSCGPDAPTLASSWWRQIRQ
jgi:hypothetical protein